jgi:hypothetical protein
MTNAIKGRIERIQERLAPETMLTVVLLRCSPIDDPEAAKSPFYIGRYGTVHFLGGSERERRKEAKRLRRSRTYDRDPFA